MVLDAAWVADTDAQCDLVFDNVSGRAMCSLAACFDEESRTALPDEYRVHACAANAREIRDP